MTTLIMIGLLSIGGMMADSSRVATVESVGDGDTFTLESGEKVRLIGVQAPELHHPRMPKEYYAEESKAFLDSTISGRQIRLDFKGRRADRNGRLLCYVRVDDSVMVNREIVARGYGMAYLRYPHKLEGEFLDLELAARRRAIGMWSSP